MCLIPEDVKSFWLMVLQFILNLLIIRKEKPDSGLNIDRNVLIGCSYYFGVSSPVSQLWYDDISRQWILSSRSNIKNYENEIETFLKWIKPYISSGSGNREMYAIVIYEDTDEPTIYYLHDGDHDYDNDNDDNDE